MGKVLKSNFSSFLLPVVILSAGVFIAYSINAQTADTAEEAIESSAAIKITFPVPELGNCTSKNECKKYCDNPINASICIAFAESHGLMNKEEASRSRRFTEAVRNGAGPGGCTTPEQCKSFCSSLNNLQVCLDFAKNQGIKDDNTDQAERISEFLKNGGKTPGNCSSKETCQKYCGDFTHAEECAAFAKAAGIFQRRSGENRDEEHVPTEEQLVKLQELAANGQTPGGCTSKDECESYCEDSSHTQECVDFGVKAGFIKAEEAEKIKKLGGRGPGGCNSETACRRFCGDPANQEECFNFGKEHGFISENESKDIKEGWVRMRAGIDQMPPEVKSCVESLIGANTIQGIESGDFVPGPETANQMRNCFEKFGKELKANDPFRNAPPEISSCLKEKLGAVADDIASGNSAPTPEMADAFRVCAEQIKLFRPNDTNQGRFNSSNQGVPSGIERFIESAPPQIEECLKNSFGDDFKNQIMAGTINPGVGDKIKACMMQFRPQGEQAPMMRQGGFGVPVEKPILNQDGFQPNALELQKRAEEQRLQQMQMQQKQNMQFQNMDGGAQFQNSGDMMIPPPPPPSSEPQTLLQYSPFGFLLRALFGY